MANKLFDSINIFESDSDLFINFAFFTFIEALGTPLLQRIQKGIHMYQTPNDFFDSLKVDCTFIKKSKDEGYLQLEFNNEKDSHEYKTLNNYDDFSTYIYSTLHILGKTINLNGRDDTFNKKELRIKLSKTTMERINNTVKTGNKCFGCKLCFNDDGIRKNPKLTSLLNLYLNDYNYNKNEYKEKMTTFEKNIAKAPKNPTNNNYTIFEIDDNGNNRIKYENLQKGEIYFLQGPPGTGKTYVIQRLIEELKENDIFNKIIISSHVHEAINNIIEKLFEGKEIPKDKYNKFYDFYQYIKILYSNRALSKMENSPASTLIELDTLVDKKEIKDAEKIYKLRKKYSNELINDFDEKIDFLNKIDYETAFSLINELSNKHYKNFVQNKEIEWGINNYSQAIKNYSNIIFCTLDNLTREIERQNTSNNILVIIDEASQSNIIHYLLLLNQIENITILILGDPRQLNQKLAFGNKTNQYAQIMASFTYSDIKEKYFKNPYNKHDIINDMKKILFKILKDSNFERYNTHQWDEILTETFFEKLFEIASVKRKKLLNNHRRSRKEIFELSKFLYEDNEEYKLVPRELDQNLLIPNYDIVTRIVIDNPEERTTTINNIIDKWKKQQENNKMTMGIITYYNEYIEEFKQNIPEINNTDISVYTVDKAQGEEFTTVILYLDLRSNSLNLTENSNIIDYHRLNVAISRAKEQLIIIETKRFIDKYKKIPKKNIDERFVKLINNIHAKPERGDSNE